MKKTTKTGCCLGFLVICIVSLISCGVSFKLTYDIMSRNRVKQYLTFAPEDEPIDDNDEYWEAYEATADLEEQLAITNDYLNRYPHSFDAMRNKAYLLIDSGDYQQGILLNQQVLDIYGEDSTTYNNLGWAYINLDQNQLAIHYLEKAIAANGGVPTYYEMVNLGDAYQGIGDYETAIAYYQRSIDEFPELAQDDSMYSYIGLMDTYKILEDESALLEICELVLELDKANSRAFINMITIYKERQDLNQILTLCEEYFLSNPEEIHSYISAAFALYELEEYELAAEYYICYADKTEYPAYGYYEAARSMVMAQQWEQARVYIAACLEFDPSYSVYLLDRELWGWLDD